jgi:hypothetical protein
VWAGGRRQWALRRRSGAAAPRAQLSNWAHTPSFLDLPCSCTTYPSPIPCRGPPLAGADWLWSAEAAAATLHFGGSLSGVAPKPANRAGRAGARPEASGDGGTTASGGQGAQPAAAAARRTAGPDPGSFSTMLSALLTARTAAAGALTMFDLAGPDWWEARGEAPPPVPPESVMLGVLRDLFHAPPAPRGGGAGGGSFSGTPSAGAAAAAAADALPSSASDMARSAAAAEAGPRSGALPRAAARNGLLARLAMHAMTFGNARAVALLWHRVLDEVRLRYWEGRALLPRMPAGAPGGGSGGGGDEAEARRAAAGGPPPPDHGACLIQQKLQLLNVCIFRAGGGGGARAALQRRGSGPARAASAALPPPPPWDPPPPAADGSDGGSDASSGGAAADSGDAPGGFLSRGGSSFGVRRRIARLGGAVAEVRRRLGEALPNVGEIIATGANSDFWQSTGGEDEGGEDEEVEEGEEDGGSASAGRMSDASDAVQEGEEEFQDAEAAGNGAAAAPAAAEEEGPSASEASLGDAAAAAAAANAAAGAARAAAAAARAAAEAAAAAAAIAAGSGSEASGSTALAPAASEGAVVDDGDAEPGRPQGVAEVVEGMRLLNFPERPLRVPVTQVRPRAQAAAAPRPPLCALHTPAASTLRRPCSFRCSFQLLCTLSILPPQEPPCHTEDQLYEQQVLAAAAACGPGAGAGPGGGGGALLDKMRMHQVGVEAGVGVY